MGYWTVTTWRKRMILQPDALQGCPVLNQERVFFLGHSKYRVYRTYQPHLVHVSQVLCHQQPFATKYDKSLSQKRAPTGKMSRLPSIKCNQPQYNGWYVPDTWGITLGDPLCATRPSHRWVIKSLEDGFNVSGDIGNAFIRDCRIRRWACDVDCGVVSRRRPAPSNVVD